MKKGLVLPSILMVLAVLSIIATAAFGTSSADNLHSVKQDHKIQAYYLAYSGAEAMGKYISDKSEELSTAEFDNFINNIKGVTSKPTYLEEGDSGCFQVTLNESDGSLSILSKGTVGNATESVVLYMQLLQHNILEGFSEALFVHNKITFEGSTKIYGSVITNFTHEDQIKFSSSAGQGIEGDLYVVNPTIEKEDINYNKNLKGSVKTLGSSMSFEMPDFPSFPTALPVTTQKYTAGWWPSPPYDISSDGWYQGGIEVQSTLNINVGNSDRIIRTSSLSVTGSGIININKTGDGKLFLYIDNSLILNNSGSINYNGDPDDLYIYYKGSSFTAGGDVKMKGHLYGENTNINISNSGNVIGHIITGGTSVTVNGDASAYVKAIYAPNATVNVNNSGKIKGVVISNIFNITGNSHIEYTSVEDDEGFMELVSGKKVYKPVMWGDVK